MILKSKVLILILLHSIHVEHAVTEADCSNVYPNTPTFMNCTYRCRCKNDELCDSQNGYCSSGCALGWMGPGCQYRNIAIYKSNIQNVGGANEPEDFADNAVDGDSGTCSKTDPNNIAGQQWLKLEWSSGYLIKGLILKLHANDLNDFSNFTVETGTEPDDSDFNNICYKHPNLPGTTKMEIICQQPVRTRYLRIKLAISDVSLRICEIEIYGGRYVSFNKETNQISTYQQFVSSKSVDGYDLFNYSGSDLEQAIGSTCSATNVSDMNPWWRVNFEYIFEIQDIYFYGRPNQVEQFSGFIMSVGNSSTITHEVFRDSTLNPVASDYQPMRTMLHETTIGQYIEIRRDLDGILTICEVLVYSDCPINSCGWNCSLPCFCQKDVTGSMKITGVCQNDCLSGWTGLDGKCDIECTNGSYGINCAESCGYCYAGKTCDRFSGYCDEGCSAGYIGNFCTDVCRNETYGINCTQDCGHCWNDSQCHHVSGWCELGCQAGWSGNHCTEECINGTYGINCSNLCGNCLNNEACDFIDGSCKHGCEVGWKGENCIDKCDGGSYGYNCSEQCGQCRGACNHITGRCQEGCEPGYLGDRCTDVCRNKTYGANCLEECGHCLNDADCNHIDGICKTDCKAGWKGDRCKNECDIGEYGLNCKESCGNCQNISHCDRHNGNCLSGCASGWNGTRCDKRCDNGTYGKGCDYMCGNCLTNYCMHTTGTCPLGCVEEFEGDMCVTKVTKTSPLTIIIGSIVGVAVLVAICIAIIIFLKRKQKKEARKTKGVAIDSLSNPHVWTRQGSNSGGEQVHSHAHETLPDRNPEHVYLNERDTTNTIQVSHLRSVCWSASKKPSHFYSEFQAIPYGLQYDASEARDKRYKLKNRYKDMYPYNSNRIVLPEIPGDDTSTYINASYIDGYRVPKRYIAAQGAIEKTVDDIWRMVWTKEIAVIVMLTRCYEFGHMKCIQYWPEEKSHNYGEICVKVKSIEKFSDFVIRTFDCCKIDTKERREVIQYHYTAWPDKDVPDTALSLAQFWGAVRKSKAYTLSPLLVHCSAGVGRTGTFIAVDYLYDQGLSENKVDIKAAVKTLREQRLNMVQTKEQYIYLHEVTAEVLDPIGTVCRTEEFAYKFNSLEYQLDDSLLQEYNKICESLKMEVGGLPDEDEIIYSNISNRQLMDSHLMENYHKSRNPEIYPADSHRPRLSIHVDGRNDFINAVFIKTFRQRDNMILTQVPVEDTIVDFIRMIWEYDVQTILLLEENIEHECQYWPLENDISCIGPFRSEVVNEERNSAYLIRTIRYSLAGKEYQKVVQQIHFKSWPGDNDTPRDTETVINLITVLENMTKDTAIPLAIQCRDGARKSGVICALISVFERMKSEGDVAIADTVRMVRQRRTQAFESFDQYKFCYRAVQDYLETQNIYSNLL